MLLAIAERAGQSEADVRRVVMLRGSIAAAAATLLGAERPTKRLRVDRGLCFRFVAPMLASPAESVDVAARKGWARPQVEMEDRAAFARRSTRTATASPSTPAMATTSPRDAARWSTCSRRCAATRSSSTPRWCSSELGGAPPVPSRTPSRAIASKTVPPGWGPPARVPLRLHASRRCSRSAGRAALRAPRGPRRGGPAGSRCSSRPRAGRLKVEDAKSFYAAALAAGNEGVVVKDLAAPYRVRGEGPRVAEGQGVHHRRRRRPRRRVGQRSSQGGLLSNLHLGARNDDGSFCMIGKTFKGLTDEMLRWQTVRLLELATEQTDHVVHVRPELVVEIRFNDVQRSPRYPGGIALHASARVVRYREDKPASENGSRSRRWSRAPPGAGKTPRRTRRRGGARRRRTRRSGSCRCSASESRGSSEGSPLRSAQVSPPAGQRIPFVGSPGCRCRCVSACSRMHAMSIERLPESGAALVEGIAIGRAILWLSDPAPRSITRTVAQERARLGRAMLRATRGVEELVRLLGAAEAELFFWASVEGPRDSSGGLEPLLFAKVDARPPSHELRPSTRPRTPRLDGSAGRRPDAVARRARPCRALGGIAPRGS